MYKPRAGTEKRARQPRRAGRGGGRRGKGRERKRERRQRWRKTRLERATRIDSC